jgi:hypothetical protein
LANGKFSAIRILETQHLTLESRPAKRRSRKEVPSKMPTDLKISIDELKKRMAAGEDITFIDTRNPQAWGQSDLMVPKAIRVPLDNLAKHIDELPKNKPIVAYCT